MLNRFPVGWGLALGLAMLGLSAQGQFSSPGLPVDPPPPTVAVRVRVPVEATPGSDLTYRITAENVSLAAAHHVRVKVSLPKNARLVRSSPPADEEAGAAVWKLGSLAGRAKREMTLILQPTGDDDVSVCARVQFEHGQCVKTRMVRPGLQLVRTGPRKGAINASLTYRLVVRNTGRGLARGVVVEETLPEGMLYLDSKPGTKGENPLSWKLGDLAPGTSRLIEYQAAAKQAGEFTLKGEVRAAGGIKRTSSLTLRVGKAGLEVVMKGPARGAVGQTVRYTISVTNPGHEELVNVRLTNKLPAEISFAGATNGGKLDGDVVRWNLGNIPAGGTRQVTLDVNSTDAGKYDNVCTARADGGLVEQANALTVFVTPRG